MRGKVSLLPRLARIARAAGSARWSGDSGL